MMSFSYMKHMGAKDLPECGKEYWYIGTNMRVYRCNKFDEMDHDDYERMVCGNCFRTAGEAKSAAERIREILKGE